MESAVMLTECVRLGIPGIAVRVISDAASVDIPIDLNAALTDAGGFSNVRFLSALARRPHALPELVRLGLDGRRSVGVIAAFLDAYVEQIGALAGRTGGATGVVVLHSVRCRVRPVNRRRIHSWILGRTF
jgi:hypothetical protein